MKRKKKINEKKPLVCIVHYPNKDESKYSAIKDISTINEERIRLAKSERESYTDENFHREQCESIPDEINHDKHGIHLDPCYKKFTLILSKKKKEPTEKSQRLSERLSSPPRKDALVYPKECNICKLYKIKVKGSFEFPITISTLNATETVKAAAMSKNQDMYYEIKDLDLISKEFKYHSSCYQDFTRGYSAKCRQETSTSSTKSTLEETTPVKRTFDIKAVEEFIKINVLRDHKTVSMSELQEIYGDKTQKDIYVRHNMKKKIVKAFGNKLIFITVRPNSPDVVISSEAVEATLEMSDKKSCIQRVASFLREDIQEYCKSLPPLSWPPTIEELCTENRLPPASITLFLTNLLKSSDESQTEKVSRLVESYSADFIHGVSKGACITKKHFLLALGLHNLTGQKKVTQITHRLGHSISYGKTCEIELAQAQKAQELAKLSSMLPLKPITALDYVLTVFWADNFDMNVEAQCGGGAIDITHMMAFQEATDGTEYISNQISVTKSKKPVTIEKTQNEQIVVNVKKEPNILVMHTTSNEDCTAVSSQFEKTYFMWLLLRYVENLI